MAGMHIFIEPRVCCATAHCEPNIKRAIEAYPARHNVFFQVEGTGRGYGMSGHESPPDLGWEGILLGAGSRIQGRFVTV
jgi:hypothetical protein